MIQNITRSLKKNAYQQRYKYVAFLLIFLLSHIESLYASDVRIKIYPDESRSSILQRIENEKWAKEVLDLAHKNVDKYVKIHQTDPEWITSRLQMYWKNKYTTPIINGAHYSRAEGKAPIPTVRYTGGRDWATDYATPKLEEIRPYMDYNDDQIYVRNNKKPGKPWEWVDNSKTAHQIESMNVNIMNRAMYSAFIYWLTGKKEYAVFSYDILMKYTEGMYYRKAPVTEKDHKNAHLLGLTSFEVIHEKVLTPMTLCYDFLYSYLQEKKADIPMIHAVFQKFADQIIEKGVADNNWNIFQARFVTYIALLLDEDINYKNGKGKNYYIDVILNKNSKRQKALRDVCQTYDQNTGIWNESCGYAVNVTKDLLEVLFLIDGIEKKNILRDFPIVEKAALANFEYLFPNRRTTAFGDSSYDLLPYSTFETLLAFYRRYGEKDKELFLTSILKQQMEEGLYDREEGASLYKLFNFIPDLLPAEPNCDSLYSSAFYAPNVNLFVMRNGMDPANGLMIVNSGSGFNHDHHNGISMELYGKGYTLGVDPGRGSSYWVSDHTDYYRKPVSHNTVVIDGISDNRSDRQNPGEASEVHHVLSCFPLCNQKDALSSSNSISYVDNQYYEAKTRSMQRRVNGILRTSPTSGYYVDIFRSRKAEGSDVMHEYFYHNLGHSLTLFDETGKELTMTQTDELTSEGGKLKGYDFLEDKKVTNSPENIRGTFTLNLKQGSNVSMDVWMQGFPGRKIFSVNSPRSLKGMRGVLSSDLAELPIPTMIIRQEGEAWNRPFVAVYEPYDTENGKTIRSVNYLKSENPDFVGISVSSSNNCQDYIFNHTNAESVTNVREISARFQGKYGVLSLEGKELKRLFIGKGKTLQMGNYGLHAANKEGTVLIESKQAGWTITADVPVNLTLPYSGVSKLTYRDKGMNRVINGEIISGKDNARCIVFQLPILKDKELKPL